MASTFVHASVVWLVGLLLWMLAAYDAFNLDTNHVLQFQGPSGSYFGFTVALYVQEHKKWLLVGAPKGNSSFLLNEYNITEPGVLYACEIDGTNNCTELIVDTTGNTIFKVNDDYSYEDLKDGGWLGVSLDTKPNGDQQIIACAHQWKNKRYRRYYLPNGVCYVLDEILQTPAHKLTPLVSFKEQIIYPGIYYYAMGQAGFSAHYTENGDNLILGAPGVMDWSGTIVYYPDTDFSSHPNGSNASLPVVPLPAVEAAEVNYFGYALTSGKFFSGEEIYFAVGAPRDNNKGRVYIISKPIKDKEQIIVKIQKEGLQMGEYFGASVCAVDVNNDGLADLFVGAPMHSIQVNEGRVYGFINEGKGFLKPLSDIIMGSRKLNSHFGTAVAAVGDLNQDDYQDIAVGSPYEDGRGAIYVYHGKASGLNPVHVQKISATDLNLNLVGFGISFSRGVDVDNNNYPDFAVGAYDSGQAVILRTRPLIRIKAKLDFDPSQIITNVSQCTFRGSPVSCFSVQSCLLFTGRHVLPSIGVKFSLDADMMRLNESRCYLSLKNGRRTHLESNITLLQDEWACQRYEVHTEANIRDYLTPVVFLLHFSFEPNSTDTGFCSNCPMLDPTVPTSVTKQIMFMKNCGDDDSCETDLRLKARIVDYGTDQPFVIGSETSITMEIVVHNNGEPAYQAGMLLVAPPWASFQRLPPTCSAAQPDSYNTVMCKLGNPMRPDEKYKTEVGVNLESIPDLEEELTFNISAFTASHEQTEKLFDNVAYLRVPLSVVADLNMIGFASQEQIFYDTDDEGNPVKDSQVVFFHIYEIFNFGPSPIDSVTIEIGVPLTSRKKDEQLIQIHDVKVGSDGTSNAPITTCDGHTRGKAAEGKNSIRQKRTTPSELKATSHYKNEYVLNCSTTKCLLIQCHVGKFVVGSKVSAKVTMSINVWRLHRRTKSIDSINITTSGFIFASSESRATQPEQHRPDWAQASSLLQSKGPPPPKTVAKWVVPVSVAAGCILMILLTSGLVKLGFFRRRKRDEMRNFMHGAQLLQDVDQFFAADNMSFEEAS